MLRTSRIRRRCARDRVLRKRVWNFAHRAGNHIEAASEGRERNPVHDKSAHQPVETLSIETHGYPTDCLSPTGRSDGDHGCRRHHAPTCPTTTMAMRCQQSARPSSVIYARDKELSQYVRPCWSLVFNFCSVARRTPRNRVLGEGVCTGLRLGVWTSDGSDRWGS